MMGAKIRCGERVRSGFYGRCGNTAKYDPDADGNPTRCGHHSKATKERKKAEHEEKQRKLLKKWDREKKIRAIEAEREQIIQAIANGHNDPRGICTDWLKRIKEARGNT